MGYDQDRQYMFTSNSNINTIILIYSGLKQLTLKEIRIAIDIKIINNVYFLLKNSFLQKLYLSKINNHTDILSDKDTYFPAKANKYIQQIFVYFIHISILIYI